MLKMPTQVVKSFFEQEHVRNRVDLGLHLPSERGLNLKQRE